MQEPWAGGQGFMGAAWWWWCCGVAVKVALALLLSRWTLVPQRWAAKSERDEQMAPSERRDPRFPNPPSRSHPTFPGPHPPQPFPKLRTGIQAPSLTGCTHGAHLMVLMERWP